MKILVTGSSGEIGSALVKVLKKKHSIKEFDISSGFNVLDFQQVKKELKGMDAVVHLAASLDEDSEKMFELNVKGTENVLQACEELEIKRVIHLSSVAVYGNNSGVNSEETEFNPVTNYEKSKAESELLAHKFLDKLDLTILRPSIVITPNIYWEKIFKAVKSEMPLIGSGKFEWQLVHRDDVVSSIVFCLNEKKTIGGIFNVAELNPYSLKEMFYFIRKLLGMKGEMKQVPGWVGYLLAYFFKIVSIFTRQKPIITTYNIKRLLRNRKYDIGSLMKLGWKPKFDLKQSLEWVYKELKDMRKL